MTVTNSWSEVVQCRKPEDHDPHEWIPVIDEEGLGGVYFICGGQPRRVISIDEKRYPDVYKEW